MDAIDDLLFNRTPTARRPLLGQTVLLIEDSRFASEAVRLMCLRSGARIRRADSLYTAQKHLAIYRPSVLIVDVGLPDGSGLDLIRQATDATSRISVVLGTSGETGMHSQVIKAGADGFIEKPITSLIAFQNTILSHVPKDQRPPTPRQLNDEVIHPELVAYQDDLAHVAQVLAGSADGHTLDYIAQFLGGVARSVHDHDINAAIGRLIRARRAGDNPLHEVAALSQMVQSRLAAAGPI